MKMNYTLGSVVTIGDEDYRIVPPHNLNAVCTGCAFKGHDGCAAPITVPCSYPSRIYLLVTPIYRERPKKNTFINFFNKIINN